MSTYTLYPLNHALKHAADCKYLSNEYPELQRDAVTVSSGTSLEAQLEKHKDSTSTLSQPTKKLQSQSEPQPNTNDLLSANDITVASLLNAHLAPFRVAGYKKSVAEQEKFLTSVNLLIIQLICSRGLVPNLIDSPEWKELMPLLSNGHYKPASMNTFIDKFIPQEAWFVCQKQIEELKQCNNLTLMFNRTDTKHQDSIYTAHATTPAH